MEVESGSEAEKKVKYKNDKKKGKKG